MSEPAKGPVGTNETARLRLRRKFVRIPMRYVLPNLVTLIGLCLGLTAIRFAVEGRFELSVIFIAGAAVLDGLDGRNRRHRPNRLHRHDRSRPDLHI